MQRFSTGSNSELIAKISEAVRIPLQIAGGIRSVEKAEEMLSMASRVVIGTMAYREPEVVRKLVKKNAGRVAISVDQMDGTVMMKGWKESTGTRVADAISQFIAIGVDEFLLTSIDRDGTLQGPDIKTLADASVSARIIASGGISSIEDVIRIKNAGCSSVIIGKAIRRQSEHRKGEGGIIMTLAKRIIPCLDVDNGRVVKECILQRSRTLVTQ